MHKGETVTGRCQQSFPTWRTVFDEQVEHRDPALKQQPLLDFQRTGGRTGNSARTTQVLCRHVLGGWEKGLAQRVAFGIRSWAGGHFSGPVSFRAYQTSISHTDGRYRRFPASSVNGSPPPSPASFSRLL